MGDIPGGSTIENDAADLQAHIHWNGLRIFPGEGQDLISLKKAYSIKEGQL